MKSKSRSRYGKLRFPGAPLVALLALLICGASFTGCERIEDSIRNWGVRRREFRIQKMQRGELEKWERDLNLSRARGEKLHRLVEELVQETALQGRLSWKIARAFCEAGNFETGTAYAREAVRNRAPGRTKMTGINPFEKSLPYFQAALARQRIEPGILYDAGLCYANASRVLGWEEDRFRTAEFLFRRMRALAPRDTRSAYQLALLYGKTTNPKLSDPDRAVRLLEDLLGRDEYNIPARFALGHLLAQNGAFHRSLEEYGVLREKLRELHERGALTGNLERNRQYIQAEKNIDQLRRCISDQSGCEILKRP